MAVSDQSVATTGTQLDQLCINTIRTLSIDAVQKANSGHPGAPMALAPVAYCLWQQFLNYDPDDPIWPNRDRFVLSNGHASMLLYSLIYLAGLREVSPEGKILSTPALSLDEIKNFRQLGSKTPGHPEYGLTTGVKTTTAPLGKGVATRCGLEIPHPNDLAALSRAYPEALEVKDRPKLIIVHSHIGYGSPHRQDSKEAHGEALGEEEVKITQPVYRLAE